MNDNKSLDCIQKEFWASATNPRPYNHPVVRIFAEQRTQFILQILGDERPNSALDVGCGDGFGMSYMNKVAARLYGCDLSLSMLKANPASRESLLCASAYNLPYADSSFDLVYCWELLHHLERPGAAVKEMARVSRKWVLVCEPNSMNPAMFLFGLIKPIERGLLKFTPGYTRKVLADAGFEKVKQYHVGLFTPNRSPMFAAKLSLKMPYRVPFFGLYSINICRKKEV